MTRREVMGLVVAGLIIAAVMFFLWVWPGLNFDSGWSRIRPVPSGR
jgi:hypothetical protein